MPERTLPQLIEGQRIKHDSLGEGEVLKNENCGTCLIRFDGTDKKFCSGVRDLHMGLAHRRIEIINQK